MATNPPSDLEPPLDGESHTVGEWLTMFHLLLVAVDPFNERSAWLVDTAGRVLEQYDESDCRVAWLVTASPDEARLFLGPWASDLTTFTDPDLVAVKALGLQTVPAIVLLALDGTVEGASEGWNPDEWRELTEKLSATLSWSRPVIPLAGDPAPFEGVAPGS